MSIKFRPTLSLDEIAKIKDWAVEDIQACLASGYDFSISAGIVQRMNGILEKYNESSKVARSASHSAQTLPLPPPLPSAPASSAPASPASQDNAQEMASSTGQVSRTIYQQINANWEDYPDHQLVSLYNMLAPNLHSYLEENAHAKCFYLACIDAGIEPDQQEDLASFNLYCKGMMLVK